MPLSGLFEVRPGNTAEQVQAILYAVRRHLGMDIGFISEFKEGDRVIRYTDSGMRYNPVPVGRSDALDKSFCHYVAKGVMPGLITDAAKHPTTAKLEATQTFPIGSHISVPLQDPDGTAFGTICCFSFKPDHTLTSRDLGVLRLCAEVVGAALKKDRQHEVERAAKQRRISMVLEKQAINCVYQPIYRTADGTLVAFEALARFPADVSAAPNVWFAEATEIGLGEELELLALHAALPALNQLDVGVNLTVNLSPAHVTSPGFAAAIAKQPLNRLVLELTENAVIADYAAIKSKLDPYRAAGMRLAIDDVGAGHSSFRHVLDLAPELIKLDKSLIRRIDTDNSRRALATAISAYSRDIGCEVVAEGVETRSEYAVLRDLGITRVQGYLTGRPMLLAEAVELTRAGFRIQLDDT